MPSGTTREQLMARFHVRDADGQLAQRRAGLPGAVGRAARLALAGPHRPPARCGLGDGARLSALPAPAACDCSAGPARVWTRLSSEAAPPSPLTDRKHP
ncbi:MAG: hypothetical protein MZV65_32895 [Chromatiales bacterium]|nr:hypothetical protein [Chromatiales bacterium]